MARTLLDDVADIAAGRVIEEEPDEERLHRDERGRLRTDHRDRESRPRRQREPTPTDRR